MFVTLISALQKAVYIGFLLTALLIGFGCAKTGTIYGGPKDEKPPEVLKAKPAEGSVNFIPQKRIVLQFNEYIQLKDLFSELIISPPMKDRLQAQVKGKSLVVEFPRDAVFGSSPLPVPAACPSWEGK